MNNMVTWQILVLLQHSSYTDVVVILYRVLLGLVSSMECAFGLFAFV